MLTEEQTTAVTSTASKSKVLAGAGTGKTTLLIARIQHLIDSGAAPESIMAITFTRRAALELSKRLGVYGTRVSTGTFHAVILRAMRAAGVNKNVLDEEAADHLLDQCAISLGMATDVGGKVKYKPHSRTHYRKAIDAYRSGKAESASSPLIDTYLTKMAINGDIDYHGILAEGLRLADNNAFAYIQHLIVDEAQDNEPLQWKIVCSIGRHATVMAVGDSGQSMYGWRGAVPEHFTGLEWESFPLTQSFRVPSNVAEMVNRTPASSVKLWSANPPVEPFVFCSDDVTGLVGQLLREGTAPEEIAVLCRYNDQVEQYTAKLMGYPVARIIEKQRGPLHHLLMHLANPSSPTSRSKVRQTWSYAAPDPLKWILSELSIGHSSSMVDNWLRKRGGSVGDILSSFEMPASLATECRSITEEHGDDTIDTYFIDESAGVSLTNLTTGIAVATMHWAKGGEWPVVILPSLDAGTWPRGKVVKDEEWRVFLVALTRTSERLYLMYNRELSVLAKVALGMETI